MFSLRGGELLTQQDRRILMVRFSAQSQSGREGRKIKQKRQEVRNIVQIVKRLVNCHLKKFTASRIGCRKGRYPLCFIKTHIIKQLTKYSAIG